MRNTIMGSPSHTLSRLIHRDDYPFANWPEYELDLIKGKIIAHISVCKHSKCIKLKAECIDSTSLFTKDA